MQINSNDFIYGSTPSGGIAPGEPIAQFFNSAAQAYDSAIVQNNLTVPLFIVIAFLLLNKAK